jgi:hypothetical protein
MNITAFKPLAARIPVGMSFAALAIVLVHLVAFGTARQTDEGTEAHIFQLLIVGQVPILVFYAVKWLPLAPKAALLVIGIQVAAVVAALAPVYLLGW